MFRADGKDFFRAIGLFPFHPRPRWILGLLSLLYTIQAFPKSDHRSEAALWTILTHEKATAFSWGLHWIPQGIWVSSLGQNLQGGAEAAFHVFVSQDYRESACPSWDIDPYRLWLRLSSAQWEIRLGLQPIHFGSAFLLRPLMWFDRLDPRDPLQLTEGVYAGLGRYVFSSNANVWGWLLLGNDKPKGWETWGTRKEIPEWGGRIQIPLPKGEVGLSFHHREGLFSSPLSPKEGNPGSKIPENRLGLDGKWDIGPGVWFEASATRYESKTSSSQKLLTVGADYTFGIGNGLHLLAETLWMTLSRTLFGTGKTVRFSAFWADYPVTVLDRLNGLFLWAWEKKEAYRLITWRRTYDRWSFYGTVFWNPKQSLWPHPGSSHAFFLGKGLQMMGVWHF